MADSYTGVNHDLRVNNGSTLYLPPWEEGQDGVWSGNLQLPGVDLYKSSAAQKYPTATILRHGLRTFIYTKTDPTYFGQKGTGDGSINAGYIVESASEMQIETNKVISGAAGANTLIVNMTTLAVNAYAGGFIGIKMGVGGRQTAGRSSMYQIIKNTVQDGNGYVTFTIDGELVIALTTADDVVITEHPFAIVRSPFTGPYGMALGVYLQQSYASRYCWVQTGGPCNFIPLNASYQGAQPYEHIGYAAGGTFQTSEGGTDTSPGGTPVSTGMQRIGEQYASTNIGGAEGSPTDTTVSPAIFLKIFN